MTFKTHSQLVYLVTLALLLAMLAVPVLGFGLIDPLLGDAPQEPTVFTVQTDDSGPAAVIACHGGGSDNNCGGG